LIADLRGRWQALGAVAIDRVLDTAAVDDALGALPPNSRGAGLRHLLRDARLARLAAGAPLVDLGSAALGVPALPFRATLFDKAPRANWLVAWHQDRFLPVVERVDDRMGAVVASRRRMASRCAGARPRARGRAPAPARRLRRSRSVARRAFISSTGLDRRAGHRRGRRAPGDRHRDRAARRGSRHVAARAARLVEAAARCAAPSAPRRVRDVTRCRRRAAPRDRSKDG
jgi:hypothetical protein